MVCQKCRSVNKLDRELFNSSEAPECSDCAENDGARVAAGHRSHGIGKLRPRIALYNEHNPDEEAITSVMNADVRTRPDALIVVGTSMKIPGVRHFVKNLCNVVRGRKNGVTMWINNEPPPGREFGESWDLVVKGNCDKVVELSDLKRLVDDSTPELPDFHDCNAAEVEDAKRKQRLSIPVPALLQKEPTGLCTPSTSNDEGPSGLPHRPAAGRPNPASKGPRLVDVLGKKPASKPASKAPRKPARKKSVPKRQGKKEPVKTSKITNFSTVTKSTSAATGKDEDKGLENATTKQMFPNLGKNATPCVEIHGRET